MGLSHWASGSSTDLRGQKSAEVTKRAEAQGGWAVIRELWELSYTRKLNSFRDKTETRPRQLGFRDQIRPRPGCRVSLLVLEVAAAGFVLCYYRVITVVAESRLALMENYKSVQCCGLGTNYVNTVNPLNIYTGSCTFNWTVRIYQ